MMPNRFSTPEYRALTQVLSADDNDKSYDKAYGMLGNVVCFIQTFACREIRIVPDKKDKSCAQKSKWVSGILRIFAIALYDELSRV